MDKNRKMKKWTLFRFLLISLEYEPLWSSVVVGGGILLGTTWGANTLCMQRLFDAAQSLLQQSAEATDLIWNLIWLGGINFANQLVNCIGNISHEIYQSRITGLFCRLLQKRTEKLHLIDYEDSSQMNRLESAQKGMKQTAEVLLILLLLAGFYFPYCLFMLVYLYSLEPVLALILPLAFIPTLLVQYLRTKDYEDMEGKMAPLRREADYYAACIADRRCFKDFRLNGGFQYFLNRHQKTVRLLNQLERKTEKRIALRESGWKCMTAAGYMGAVGLLLFLMLKGRISVGSFAAVFASMNSVFSIMEEIVFYNLSRLQSSMGTIRHFAEYISGGEAETGNLHKKTGWLEAKNLSFSYPDAARNAITDLSLKIRKGETIALVGENGSGKTTLVRLLAGLYEPSAGVVLHEGIPTTEYRYAQIGKGTTGIFQQFQKYRMKLLENVFISQPETKPDEASIFEALKRAGFDAGKLSEGLNTMLSKEFGGTDLSGGEWQRVAMARGIYRDHDLLLMDEPTAAMDPIREKQFYRLLSDISKGKTMVLVSHRLSSVQFADRIVVMKNGRIIEMGTHQQLLSQNGEYAEMFEAQRE